MKRKLYLAAALLTAALSTAACAGKDSGKATAAYIGIEAAKDAALNSAGLSPSQAEFSSAGLEEKEGIFFYRVSFAAGEVEYEYAVDALTGIVIEEIYEEPSYRSEERQPQPDEHPTQPDEHPDQPDEQPAQPDKQPAQAEGRPLQSGEQPIPGGSAPGRADASYAKPKPATGPIDAGEAENIALAHAGVSREAVKKLETKEDRDGGLILFEVKFYGLDGGKYEYEIDAATGKIHSFDSELPERAQGGGYYGSGLGTSVSDSLIGEDAARQKALERVPGASKEAVSLSLEEDDGRMEYEGKLIFDGMEYEFKIDAYSGALVKWEAEPYD